MSKGKRKLGRGVAVVGVGMSQFGILPGMNCREMFAEAFKDMRKSVDNAEKYSLGVGTITPLVLLHNQSVVLLILYLALHHCYLLRR